MPGTNRHCWQGSTRSRARRTGVEEIEKLPAAERHLRTHEGHLTYLNDTDRKVIDGSIIEQLTFSGSWSSFASVWWTCESAGVTEVVYQPSGPDIERELTAFARMAEIEGG